MLNSSDKVTDFNINSGLELGRAIDHLLKSAKMALKNDSFTAAPVPVKLPEKPADPQAAKPAEKPAAKKPVAAPAETPADVFGKIRQYIQNNQLVRLRANRHGKQVSMPCRILNLDETENSLSVYHVDEKQVYTFKLNEIDEFL